MFDEPEEEDDEELFPVLIRVEDKAVIRLLMMFETHVMFIDESKDDELKQMLAETSREMHTMIWETLEGEAVPLTMIMLLIFYNTLRTGLNIRHTEPVKEDFKLLLGADQKVTALQLEKFLADSRRRSAYYLDFIEENYGEHPAIKSAIAKSKETWRRDENDELC